ncbi:Radial spoke head protein 4 A [Quaeritorhiza haematococci]|nr:Radial spoke head protein 4 A [Quaeritorhiza haematococci]
MDEQQQQQPVDDATTVAAEQQNMEESPAAAPPVSDGESAPAETADAAPSSDQPAPVAASSKPPSQRASLAGSAAAPQQVAPGSARASMANILAAAALSRAASKTGSQANLEANAQSQHGSARGSVANLVPQPPPAAAGTQSHPASRRASQVQPVVADAPPHGLASHPASQRGSQVQLARSQHPSQRSSQVDLQQKDQAAQQPQPSLSHHASATNIAAGSHHASQRGSQVDLTGRVSTAGVAAAPAPAEIRNSQTELRNSQTGINTLGKAPSLSQLRQSQTRLNDASAPAEKRPSAPTSQRNSTSMAPAPAERVLEHSSARNSTAALAAAAAASVLGGGPFSISQPTGIALAATPNDTGTIDFNDYHRKERDTHMPEEAEVTEAKSFLMTNSDKTGFNLYDHLTTVLMRVLETRPRNAVDFFEAISSEVKRSHFKFEQKDTPAGFKDAFALSNSHLLAKATAQLFERLSPERADADKGDAASGELPDIMELSKLWEWAGVSFGQEEMFVLFLSLRRLAEEKPLKSVRLWGKIFGLQKNYIVVEGELREGAVDEDDLIANGNPEAAAAAAAEEEREYQAALQALKSNAGEQQQQPQGDGAAPPADVAHQVDENGNPVNHAAPDPLLNDEATLPKPKMKVIPPLPKERGVGVNKYVYYVCHYAGGPWTRLPDVIPEKLQAARRIRKYFTGDLKHKIVSYPAFDGTEAQYLRCQIARISAATVVSPNGYYTFDPEEAENDENEQNSTIIINPEYEGAANEALLNLSNWVHHVPYILPQGRVTWENPYAALRANKEGGEDGEDEDDDAASNEDSQDSAEGNEDLEPEQGPPILSPLTADEDNGDVPSWIARACSTFSPTKFSPVVLRSTRWPGAHVVAYNDKFANVYIGDGLKDLGSPTPTFTMPQLPDIQKEYGSGVEGAPGAPAEITEQNDPTLEEEKAFEEEKKKKEEEEKRAAGGEDGEEGSEAGSEEQEEEE